MSPSSAGNERSDDSARPLDGEEGRGEKELRDTRSARWADSRSRHGLLRLNPLRHGVRVL
jgi:hypothetical protein